MIEKKINLNSLGRKVTYYSLSDDEIKSLDCIECYKLVHVINHNGELIFDSMYHLGTYDKNTLHVHESNAWSHDVSFINRHLFHTFRDLDSCKEMLVFYKTDINHYYMNYDLQIVKCLIPKNSKHIKFSLIGPKVILSSSIIISELIDFDVDTFDKNFFENLAILKK